MRVLLVLSAFLAVVTSKPAQGDGEPIILHDPPRPPPPIPTNEINPEALPRDFTEDGSRLWEGDMVLTEDQVDFLYGPINTRKAISDVNKRWPNGNVPFAISQSSAKDRQAILAGLKHWTDNSCITFTEVQEGVAKPHIIFKKLIGCHSAVGMQYNRNGQDVSIGRNCEGMGTVAHEVGHALGFFHEQCRPDRNSYVKVLDANINKTFARNFVIHNDADSEGVPYDLGSVMHYGLDFFTINGRNTMVPLDIHQTFKIGQREGLSFYDLKLANIMYSCNANCRSKPACQNGGFVDHNCRCRCPPGFSGQVCQSRVNVPGPVCGGDYTSPATVSTPNYPRKYSKGSKCVWVFQAPAGRRVRAYFPAFNVLKRSPQGTCPWDFLEVRTNNMIDGDKYCAQELNGMEITSGTNKMALLFKSDYDWSTGFEAEVTFV